MKCGQVQGARYLFEEEHFRGQSLIFARSGELGTTLLARSPLSPTTKIKNDDKMIQAEGVESLSQNKGFAKLVEIEATWACYLQRRCDKSFVIGWIYLSTMFSYLLSSFFPISGN